VFESVFDFGPCLFGVGLGLIGAALGAQPSVTGGAAEIFLGGALDGFGLVRELLYRCSLRFPSVSVAQTATAG
jgi:hypothetical protein